MQRTIIIYESNSGLIESVVKDIALIVGPARYCKVGDFSKDYTKFDLFVLGLSLHENNCAGMLEFVKENIQWLREKKIILFCISPENKRGSVALNRFREVLGESILYTKILESSEKLSQEEYESVKLYIQKSLDMPLQSLNMFNIFKVIEFAIEIKNIKEKHISELSKDKLKFFVEEFLSCHNTCTLSTSYGRKVRGTPIEYTYKDGHMYFISEGGEKFANLLLNSEVSISIYDNYENPAKIAGMQIDGTASIVEYESREYNRILEIKRMNIEHVKSLPVRMNIIKAKLLKAEFIYYKFKTLGYDIRQEYDF